MKALLLLGVVPEGTAPQTGTEHVFTRAARWSGLSQWFDVQDGDDADQMAAWAEHQNALLAQYVSDGDVLPVSLGAVFSSEDAIRRHLTEEADTLDTIAAPIRGACEYALQIRADRAPKDTPRRLTGAAYLQARRTARNARTTLAADRLNFTHAVARSASKIAREVQERDAQGRAPLADLALLVPRDNTARLVETLAAQAMGAQTLGLTLRLTGPMPPYSFARTPVTGAPAHA